MEENHAQAISVRTHLLYLDIFHLGTSPRGGQCLVIRIRRIKRRRHITPDMPVFIYKFSL